MVIINTITIIHVLWPNAVADKPRCYDSSEIIMNCYQKSDGQITLVVVATFGTYINGVRYTAVGSLFSVHRISHPAISLYSERVYSQLNGISLWRSARS